VFFGRNYTPVSSQKFPSLIGLLSRLVGYLHDCSHGPRRSSPQFPSCFVPTQANLLCVFISNQISFVAGAFLQWFLWAWSTLTCFHRQVHTDRGRSSGVPTQDGLTGRQTLLVFQTFPLQQLFLHAITAGKLFTRLVLNEGLGVRLRLLQQHLRK
jgi:hypothetical protein